MFILNFLALASIAFGGEEGELRKLTIENEVLSPNGQLSISIKINEARDVIELDLIGPSDVYYAVGFGSTVMVNTWSIVVNGDGEDGWFEQTLSNHRAGLQRAVKSFDMMENSFTAESFQRRLHLKTSLTSLSSYHPFDVDDEAIDLIWAIGTDTEFVQHIDYGTKTFNYRIEGASSPNPPHDVWIYFGDMNLSAMIVVVGMILLFIILLGYWLWKLYKYLKERAEERENNEKFNAEKDPLLKNCVSDGSNNRYIVV